MGRVVLGVIVWSALHVSLAAADDAITPTPAPADVNWYATTHAGQGVDGSADQTWRPIRVNRGGLFALAGISHMAGHFFGRIDLGTPIPTRHLPHLRVLVAVGSRYGSESDTSTSDLTIAPELQYDWRLPIETRRGDIVVVAGAGIERLQHWVRMPDEPFWPSRWESVTYYAYKLDLAVQLRARNGLVLSLQPLGAVLPYSEPQSPDPRWMVTKPDTAYELDLSVGYQLP